MDSNENDGFKEWLRQNAESMEGEDNAETLMHMAWKAALEHKRAVATSEYVRRWGEGHGINRVD